MYGHVTAAGARLFKRIFIGILLVGLLIGPVHAVDLPKAAGSPVAGIGFDDQPLILPVQRNFQMAMLLASSELGRSCGKMEAYGWRLSETEQSRVNQIFNNTVDRLRAQGFAVESKASSIVSSDVTLFSADRPDKHLILMWSAGEIGLVMVLCETSAPLSPTAENVMTVEGAGTSASPMPLLTGRFARPAGEAALSTMSERSQPLRMTRTGKPVFEHFSPVGSWIGSYACTQGTTGATLVIDSLKGDQFKGTFHFYPTSKNAYVPEGKYKVSGEYDADSLRILINPGEWIKRPKDYYHTIMIGSFDPVAGTFSGFFQGIMGCTSFEARVDKAAHSIAGKKDVVKKAQKTTKKRLKTKTAPSAIAPKAKQKSTEKEISTGIHVDE